MSEKDKKVYSLASLHIALERHVVKHFGAQQFWVTAEITKVNYKAGHCYLELADTKENQLIAKASAHIWYTALSAIKAQLGEVFSQIVQPGNKVLLLLKIVFHPVHGFKLNVMDIDPNYTFGEIEKRKQETITKLKKEGVFDLQKQLYFPTVSRRLAVVGSPKTSGYRDFMDEIYNNPVYRKFVVKTFPSSVQGDRAEVELISAIQEAAKYDVDGIVLIRGGGSKMDLDVFNKYELCKAICLCKKPILTGIGHETDQVVADLVAHLNFITPTAVAKHLYVQIGNFRHILLRYNDQVVNRSLELLSGAKDEFNYLQKYLVHHSKEVIQSWKERFRELTFQVSDLGRKNLFKNQEELSQLVFDMKQSFFVQLQQERINLQRAQDSVKAYASQLIDQEQHHVLGQTLDKIVQRSWYSLENEHVKIQHLEELLALLNPEKMLAAGYTLTTIDDLDINKNKLPLAGKTMVTLTDALIITSVIEKVTKHNFNKQKEN